MSLEVLSPVSADVFAYIKQKSSHSIGNLISIHSEEKGIPELKKGNIAILGVLESKRTSNINELNSIDGFRKSFYSLFPGHWHQDIIDLGDIKAGHTFEDTCFALISILSLLLKEQIIPVIIGGSQALTYAQYRAYDKIKSMINIVNVDACFDMGNADEELHTSNFVSKAVLNQPYNLFNYASLGYQTYFNAQEEIDLMEQLNFESYRLGELSQEIETAEPALRDADIVSIDKNSIKVSELNTNENGSANGFDSREICAITRYAGISEKLTSLGCYEFALNLEIDKTSNLLAQMIWYFIEGVNLRVEEDTKLDLKYYQKFSVLQNEREIIFFKSLKTGRWWIEIPFFQNVNNKLKKQSLLPCTTQDYEAAMRGILPERWLKAIKKNAL